MTVTGSVTQPNQHGRVGTAWTKAHPHGSISTLAAHVEGRARRRHENLQVHLRVDAGVVKHDGVGGGEVDALTAGPGGDEVGKVGAALRVEGPHVQLPPHALRGAVEAKESVPAVTAKLLDYVQRLGVLPDTRRRHQPLAPVHWRKMSSEYFHESGLFGISIVPTHPVLYF